MHILLFGYRGCGKTSIGKRLAGELWKDFVDTDDVVRKRFGGITIAEIWEQWGEPGFRQAEIEAVDGLLKQEDLVIGLGGGTLMQEPAALAIAGADNCKRIYLECEPEVLLRRIEGDAASATERPALTDQGGGLEEIKQVLADRDPVYRATADIVFDVSLCSIEEAVRCLIAKL